MTLVKVSYLLNESLMVLQGQIFVGWIVSSSRSVHDQWWSVCLQRGFL